MTREEREALCRPYTFYEWARGHPWQRILIRLRMMRKVAGGPGELSPHLIREAAEILYSLDNWYWQVFINEFIDTYT